MASKYNVDKLRQALQEQKEIDASKYDGSYELVRETIKAYSNIEDYSEIDYNDLNLVYLMAIGTWKHGIDRKKEIIKTSHLSSEDKEHLTTLLDQLWTKALNHEYVNHSDNPNGQIGMFGTGFYSFMNKTTKKCSEDFIKMCVDILALNDDEEIFNRAETVLTKDFHGMKSAAASVVLHCLKPGTFPILNTNMGADNIFEALGIKLRKKADIDTYINNCRLIKKYRDKNFQFKNYRVFDIAARELPQFLENEMQDAVIDIEKLKAEITKYKAEFSRVNVEEIYKWEAVKCFKDNFDIDAPDFVEMLRRSFEKSGNLLSRMNFLAKAGILEIAGHNPEYCRNMFRNLFDESEPVLNRIQQFEDDSEIYYTFKPDRSKKTYQDAKASTIYLFFMYPEKYYIYMSMKFEYAALQLGYDNIPKAGSAERIQAYFDFCDQIWNYAKTDSELLELNESRLNEKCYKDPENASEPNHILAEDLAFFISGSYKSEHKKTTDDETEGYFPMLEDYDPGISASQYEEIFTNDSFVKPHQLDTLYYLYKQGEGKTCKQLADIYGDTYGHYNSNGRIVAEAVYKYTNCSLYKGSDGKEQYWPILFFGKNTSGSDGTFVWKLRKPVEKAIESMDKKGLFKDMASTVENPKNKVEYPKNMILYGPPGTGKTYNTVLYAVAICECKSLADLEQDLNEIVVQRNSAVSDDNSHVSLYDIALEKFNELAKKGRIKFVTFHQSYGYEEFIEGIKPILENDSQGQNGEVKYIVEPGVFQRFCGLADENRVDARKSLAEIDAKNKAKIKALKFLTNAINDEVEISLKKGKNSFVVLECDEENGDILVKPEFGKVDVLSLNLKDLITVVSSDKELQNLKDVRDILGAKFIFQQHSYYYALAEKINSEIVDSAEVTTQKVEEEPYVFIIDEINRGNISKIFGELITLIEPTKRLGADEAMTANLPYSKKSFGVPENVYILGTMNTADRSIALMDTALRRRFEFVEMMPNTDILNKIDIAGINVKDMLDAINNRIEYFYDREHTIGHAYFTKLLDVKNQNIEELAKIFKNKVIPLLQEYFYDDYMKIYYILGDNGKTDAAFRFVVEDEAEAKSIFIDNRLEDEKIFTRNRNQKKYKLNSKEDPYSHIESYKGIYSEKKEASSGAK